VYFVAVNGFIKIGFAGDVISRARTIWCNWPGFEIEPLGWIRLRDFPSGTYELDIEAVMHQRFAHLRERGEWFLDDAEIRNWVTQYARQWPRRPAPRSVRP
jgi:hypothetical protein